jgi:hypothetical protein
MFPRLLRCCLVGSWALFVGLATAQEPANKLPPPTPAEERPAQPALPPEIVTVPIALDHADCCAPCDVEQTYPVKRVQIAEVQEAITLPRLPVREEITKIPFVGVGIEYREEKQPITYLVTKVRTELRQVQSMSVVPETTVDPCTGCPCTTYKEVPICQSVPVEVVDVVPETKLGVIKVPVLKCVNKVAVVKRVVVDETTVPASVTHFQAVEASTDVTTSLPLPHPPSPAPPLPGCVHGPCR